MSEALGSRVGWQNFKIEAVELRITEVRMPLGRVEISEARTEVGKLAVKSNSMDNKAAWVTRPKAEGVHFRTCQWD